MKTRIISAVALLLCAFMLLSGCAQPKYKRISFDSTDEELGDRDIDYLDEDAEVVDCMSERFAPKTLPVYEISRDPFTEEEIKQLEDIFHPVETDIIDEHNIFFEMAHNIPDDKEIVLSPEEIEEKAWEYFNMIPGLDAKDFKFHLNAGASIANYHDKRYITLRTVRFYRIIDGFRVNGNEGYTMTFNADGELLWLHLVRFSYTKTDKTIELIPETEAFKRIKFPDEFVLQKSNYLDQYKSVNNLNHARRLKVERFEIQYVNAFDGLGCTILQPVYKYSGRALGNEEESEANTNFISRIIAISEKCTYTPKINLDPIGEIAG